MRYKTKQNLWVLSFVVVLSLNAFLFYKPGETAKMLIDPQETCPEYTFYVVETQSCVPFRNDQQEYLYNQNIAGSTKTIQAYEKEN